ncbi:MAG TPA: hydrogenase maturation protease [Solirubrobacteraceae bacterium]|nr:hydrogenase maturation protease [Solirubrobacteraceae bacterium]
MLRLIGVGNRWRGDDAAGLVVAAGVRARLRGGIAVIEDRCEPLELIEACEGAQAAWLVDAVCSGAPPGTLHRFDAAERALPAGLFRVSTHRLGVADALELARALGRLPPRVVVYGIEGSRFAPGRPLSPAVAAAAERLAGALSTELAACAAGR